MRGFQNQGHFFEKDHWVVSILMPKDIASFDILSKGSLSGRPLNPTEDPSLETTNSVCISLVFLCDFDCSTYTGNVNSSQYQGYFQGFLSTTVFFLRRLSFSREGINFRSAFWHEYPWIHSWIGIFMWLKH